jgi:hypothetical protein
MILKDSRFALVGLAALPLVRLGGYRRLVGKTAVRRSFVISNEDHKRGRTAAPLRGREAPESHEARSAESDERSESLARQLTLYPLGCRLSTCPGGRATSTASISFRAPST